MNKSTKAALLSAFVLPGAGHFFLRRYIPATILAGASLVGVYYVLNVALEIIWRLSEKIKSGEVSADFLTLNRMVSNQLAATENSAVSTVTSLLVICWIIGIVDSYWMGRKVDRKRENK